MSTTYKYALYLGPLLMLRTMTRSKAERENERKFQGRCNVVEQVYIGGTH